MTPQLIADELRPLVRGRLSIDDLTRRLHSTDASPFQIVPAAVFVPLDEADLQVAVNYAFEHGLPIVPRGAGTGLAGEALGDGLVIDLSVSFRRILEIGDDFIRVQAGTTLREVNDALRSHGRRFAIAMPNADVVTLGGMIATNASGGTAFRHGFTADHVLALKIITDSGASEEIENRPSTIETGRAILVRSLIQANEDLLRAAQPKITFSRAGYRLHDLVSPEGVNLLPLIVGSEGTLAITTEATLRTIPLAGGVAQFAIGFATLDDALSAGLTLRRHDGIAAADLLDQRLLALARLGKSGLAIPADSTAALVVTHEADCEADALRLALHSYEAIRGSHAILAEPTTSLEGCAAIAGFRESAVYGFYSLPSAKRPEAIVEDIGIPPDTLPQFLGIAQELLREANLTASFLVHVLTGTVHCRPLVDLTDPADQAKAWPLANHLYELAIALGGTISAQHGVGLARTPWIEKQFPTLLPLFREVKRIFDPKNILNPGKIVGPDPSRPAWPFRSRGQGSGVGDQGRTDEPGLKPELLFVPMELTMLSAEAFSSEVGKCNACGDCRVRSAPSRMCPVFRATGEEAATPRAKANMLRAVIDEPQRLSDDDVKSVAKLCIQCTRCRDDCKAGIDVPTLMLEAKAAHYAAHGFDRGEWLIARSERLAAVAGTFAFTANVLLSWRPTRWLLEKLIGLSRRRMLHRFTHRTYLRRRLFRREQPGDRKLAYFVDSFANTSDPLLAEATVAVLEHHGFRVTVPRRQRASGMAPLSVGDVDRARSAAEYNVRTFAELVRDGYTVVCSEPSAALAITTEYPRLLKSEDAKLVAANTVELTALLGELQARGELKPTTRELPFEVAHHVPCHLKSLGTVSTPELLGSIAKLSVKPVDVGCSGSAGPWGLSKANFDLSMQIGAPVFAALEGSRFGTTECSACRMQLQQGSGLRVLHPVQWLALAYGLVPQLEARLTRKLRPGLTG